MSDGANWRFQYPTVPGPPGRCVQFHRQSLVQWTSALMASQRDARYALSSPSATATTIATSECDSYTITATETSCKANNRLYRLYQLYCPLIHPGTSTTTFAAQCHRCLCLCSSCTSLESTEAATCADETLVRNLSIFHHSCLRDTILPTLTSEMLCAHRVTNTAIVYPELPQWMPCFLPQPRVTSPAHAYPISTRAPTLCSCRLRIPRPNRP